VKGGQEDGEGSRNRTGREDLDSLVALYLHVVPIRAVLTNGHTGHVPRAPGLFLFEGPQLAVVK